MNIHPAYIDSIEPIVLYDELAEFLGAVKDGIYSIEYFEIVKMAGHSCATVAGAWLMAAHGLKALYKDELPRRGEIRVELRHGVQERHSGVVGMVLTNITGATRDDGFGGIPTGKFDRTGLLHYSAPIETDVRFTRLDTEKSVGVNYRPERIVNPMQILKSAIKPDATEEDKATFPHRFQQMVATVFERQNEVIEVVL